MSGVKATISYKLVNGYIEAATRVAVSAGELDAIVEARRLNFPRLRWGTLDTTGKIPLFNIPYQESLLQPQTFLETELGRKNSAMSPAVSGSPLHTETMSSAAAAGGDGVDVVMPQLGESISEGTITKWLKKPGERVLRDEPLFEISTDKVDAEIPSPSSGILREIKVLEGSTVQVNTVVGVIAVSGFKATGLPSSATGPHSGGEKKRGEILSWQILILSEIHLALCVRNKKYAKEIATLKNNAKLLISAIAGYVAAAVGAVEAIIAALVAAMLRIVLSMSQSVFCRRMEGLFPK